MSNRKGKRSIKTRILVSILVLIGVIFCCIILAFNSLVNTNIEKNAINQLETAIRIVEKNNGNQMGTGIGNNNRMPQMKSRAELLIINATYGLEYPKSDNEFMNNGEKYKALIEKIKSGGYQLGNGEMIRLTTEFGDYYAATIKVNTSDLPQQLYMVFFVDITSNIELAVQINLMLILILAFAFLLATLTAIILAGKIAKPIKELTGFAERIGEGDFTECRVDFSDREISKLADIMNKSAAQLAKYDKEQKIFFQNASHELRTPLMSMKGYAEAIKYKVIESERAADIILEETDKLTEMVEDLLYISKIDNISRDYVKTNCDLREILSDCCITEKARALNKGVEFVYEFDQKPVMFECDEKNMSRALLNIIDNGVRYARTKIVVSCEIEMEKKNAGKNKREKILICIENDGEGISQEDAPHIFDRFYKGSGGKNGIGLAVVRSVVEEHNGKIWVENVGLEKTGAENAGTENAGTGTRFNISFKK